MWSKSKEYNVYDLCDVSVSPLVRSPAVQLQDDQSDLLAERSFHFISSLAYSIVPSIDPNESFPLLKWVLSRWCKDLTDLESLRAIELTQIEYFFFGTDNGHVYNIPLIPSSTLRAVAEVSQEKQWCCELQKDINSKQNNNCGPRRILHQHAREEPVLGLDVLGTIIASSSSDRSVALSFFHPAPRNIVLIPHSHPLRCVKLWDGEVFTYNLTPAECATRAEHTAVYLLSGDEAAVTRLWRVDVLSGTYVLLHIFVMTPNLLGNHSPLDASKKEDLTKSPVQRETDLAVHCLLLDNNERLLAGVEGGVYCWSVNHLPWKKDFSSAHPLLWNEESCSKDSNGYISSKQVLIRAKRLVNHHIWVRDVEYVTHALNNWSTNRPSGASNRMPTRWKSKHTRTIAGGNSVGLVSNDLESFGFQEADPEPLSVLHNSLVTVSFEEGELRNDVVLPASCVEPVVYPLTHLATPTAACFAMDILQSGQLLVTSGSDTLIHLWRWDGSQETYSPLIVAGEKGRARGLGRHIRVLHAPSVFLSCGYDDGLIREWHLHFDSQLSLRCERRFTLLPASEMSHTGLTANEGKKDLISSCVSGISCLVVLPSFGALCAVGVFESTIQSYRLSECQGCEAPPNFLYNGFKTISIPSSMASETFGYFQSSE